VGAVVLSLSSPAPASAFGRVLSAGCRAGRVLAQTLDAPIITFEALLS